MAKARGDGMVDGKNHSSYDVGAGQIGIGKTVIYCVCIFILLVLGTFLQISGIEIFGAVPAISLALVCAVGFIFGDKYGAIFAILRARLWIFCQARDFHSFPLCIFFADTFAESFAE